MTNSIGAKFAEFLLWSAALTLLMFHDMIIL